MRRDGSFISDGGFKVAGWETTSIGEMLMGSACPPDVVKQTTIPGDFTFRPDMGNYVGNTEQQRTFFIVWKIKLLLPFLSFPAACPDPALPSISMSSYRSFRHTPANLRVIVRIAGSRDIDRSREAINRVELKQRDVSITIRRIELLCVFDARLRLSRLSSWQR